MTSKEASARVLVGRIQGQTFTVLGTGVAVEPSFVLVSLTMSGPLRPRAGVVVVPEGAGPGTQAVPVRRIHRGEHHRTDPLALELAAPLRCAMASPDRIDGLDGWLTDRLEGSSRAAGADLDGDGQTGMATGSGTEGRPDDVGEDDPDTAGGRTRWLCVVYPPACR